VNPPASAQAAFKRLDFEPVFASLKGPAFVFRQCLGQRQKVVEQSRGRVRDGDGFASGGRLCRFLFAGSGKRFRNGLPVQEVRVLPGGSRDFGVFRRFQFLGFRFLHDFRVFRLAGGSSGLGDFRQLFGLFDFRHQFRGFLFRECVFTGIGRFFRDRIRSA